MRPRQKRSGQLLLRQEIFGGTLFDPETGLRAYINGDEFNVSERDGCIGELLRRELRLANGAVKIIRPSTLPSNNFSAPDTAFIEVTRACNLRCKHCLNSSGVRLPDELSEAELKTVIDDLASSGVQEIRFTGGEPMAFPGIARLIEAASSLGLRCSMGTNGVLITEEVAAELAAVGLHAGVISLDGLEERHEAIRGRSTYSRSLNGLKHLRAVGVDVRVNVVVMRSNLSDIVPLVEFLVAAGVPVVLRRLILSGRARSSSEEMLHEHEYAELRQKLEVQLDDPRNLVSGHYLRAEQVQPRIQLPFARKQCSAGHRGLVIQPNGAVQTCGFLGPLGESSVGVMPTETLSRIWAQLNSSSRISQLEAGVAAYNSTTNGPKTNCLAIGLSGQMAPVTLKLNIREEP